MATITFACNCYMESNSLPGWLEMATGFADDVFVLHAGPGGKKSTDGTIEILQKWRIRTLYDEIDKGFGYIRTRLLRECKTDYCCILDCDERFLQHAPLLKCAGQPTPQQVVDAILGEYSSPVLQGYDTADGRSEPGKVPSNWENLKQLGLGLSVTQTGVHDQGGYLRGILDKQKPDVVAMIRRHWHDFTLRRPTQDWQRIPDYQYRLIRCDERIGFDPGKKMHEQLRGFDPAKVARGHPLYGVLIEHHHLALKAQEPLQRVHDVAIYDAIHQGRTPPTEEEFRESLRKTKETA